TGHGVPGAFMSMICVQLLNLVVRDRHVTATEQALQLLDEGVRRALHQSGSDHDTTDGMDIALCAFDLSNNTVQYSGAYRPLYVIRKGELIEVPANKFSIGGHKNIDKNFSGSKVLLEKGDMIYLFTDGFADQFGGKDGKKFKLKNFKKLLLSVCDKPVQEQHRIIERTMDDWKSNQQQLDDILVMGMRI
ncbi:MAG TPA: SpoIIE family protein phosphatase, partial [Bacteroidia bacterium]